VDGFYVIFTYNSEYAGRIWLPYALSIYPKNHENYFENFVYLKKSKKLVVENNEEKKEINVQTIPLTEEPFRDYKLYTNIEYNFELEISGGNAVICIFKIEKTGSSDIEEVVLKDDMSEYKIVILESLSIGSY